MGTAGGRGTVLRTDDEATAVVGAPDHDGQAGLDGVLDAELLEHLWHWVAVLEAQGEDAAELSLGVLHS